MTAAAELRHDEDTGPRIQLGSKFLNRFEDRFELVQLRPPVLRQHGGDVSMEFDSIQRMVEAIERDELVLLQSGKP